MNYTTEYRKTLEETEVLFSDQAGMDNNKGTKRREEITIATHNTKGVVIKLDYYEGVNFYTSKGEFFCEASPKEFIRSFTPKPYAEFKKDAEDYHASTIRNIRQRGDFIRELVSGL